MPIYEYACPDCKHQFDAFQKMSDPPISTCPSCGGGGVKKLISATAFVLKGGGWYKDHYGLKSGGSDSGSSGGSSGSSGGSSSSGSSSGGSSGGDSGGSSSGGTSSGGSSGGSSGSTASSTASS